MIKAQKNKQYLDQDEQPNLSSKVPEGKKLYRIINLVSPTFSSEKALETVNSIIEKREIFRQKSSIEQFAYSVKKYSQGHQIVTDLACDPSEIMSIRRKMELNSNIIRTLVINQSMKKCNKFLSREIIGEDLRRLMSQFTVKRGSMTFSKSKSTRDRKPIAKAIKMLRFISFLPYCRYDS